MVARGCTHSTVDSYLIVLSAELWCGLVSYFTTARFQQVAICLPWMGWSCLSRLLTYWLDRSASQERFYDSHHGSKSTCRPQTTVSPSERLSLTIRSTFSDCPVVSVRTSDLYSNGVWVKLTVDFLSHDSRWTDLVIVWSSLSLFSTRLVIILRIFQLWRDLLHVSTRGFWRVSHTPTSFKGHVQNRSDLNVKIII